MNFSASLVRRLKAAQAIFVNGEAVYTSHVLKTGDTVEVDLYAAEPECDIVPEEGEVNVIFENEGLIALNKPAGILVHPSRSRYMGTLSNFCAGYLKEKGLPPCCHAVNRLDRDTSGVVLFAKNSHFKDVASKALGKENAKKEYLALVCGCPADKTGAISLPIKRLNEGDMLRVVAPDGQKAITHYEILCSGKILGETVSLLKLRLETGRTHQIRVHCLALGFPLLGDILYYTDKSRALSEKLNISAQALHAESLTFTDPTSKNEVTLTADIIRQDMKNILSELDF